MSSPNVSPVHDRPIFVGHAPSRPSWLCRNCADPWPCVSARMTLRAVYDDDPVGLAVLLSGYLHDACGDLLDLDPDVTPEALFVRFVLWTRRKPPL